MALLKGMFGDVSKDNMQINDIGLFKKLLFNDHMDEPTLVKLGGVFVCEKILSTALTDLFFDGNAVFFRHLVL